MAEKDIEYLNSLPDDTPSAGPSGPPEKKGRALWSPEEETLLIASVLDREEDLYGDFQGAGCKSGKEKKMQGWEEVTGIINAQFSSWKRSAEVCRKKYNNAKQRAKEKIDSLRKERRKTGGGQVEVNMTVAEEVLIARQDGRPGLFGLESGFDSDETQNIRSKEVEVEHSNTGNKGKGVKRDKGSKRSLAEENLIEDTKRIRLHQKKLELEMIKLEKEIKMLEAQTEYYKAKTNNES